MGLKVAAQHDLSLLEWLGSLASSHLTGCSARPQLCLSFLRGHQAGSPLVMTRHTRQTPRRKRCGGVVYSQALRIYKQGHFVFKKGRDNTGGLRGGLWAGGLGHTTPAPACPVRPLSGPEGWLVTEGEVLGEAGR